MFAAFDAMIANMLAAPFMLSARGLGALQR
jgi:hypothetical protein